MQNSFDDFVFIASIDDSVMILDCLPGWHINRNSRREQKQDVSVGELRSAHSVDLRLLDSTSWVLCQTGLSSPTAPHAIRAEGAVPTG